jgi:large subunit ribosomal protein L23
MNRCVIKSKNKIGFERAYDIIRAPIVTEKATLMSQDRQYAFYVAPDANKIEIRQAIEMIFNVKVEGVSTLNSKGKIKRFRGRLGQRPDFKKAYVKLLDGHTIDIGAGL